MAQTKTVKGIKYKKTTGGWFRAGGQKKAATGGTVTPADYIRLGPQAAQLKATMTPAKWAQAVKAAHAQGWTVASALDADTPAALKQKTQKSIRASAQRQVDDAYKPALAELDTAASTAGGLRQKRINDQASYDQWASQQASRIAGSINAAQTKYFDTIKASTDAQVADAKQTAATFAGKAGAGGISDLSGSVAQANVTRSSQASQDAAAARQARAAATGPEDAVRAGAVESAALGSAYQRRGQIEGDYSKTLAAIGAERGKLNVSRASDQVKAYADLLQTEMDKASSNRDFQGLQAQIKSKADIAKGQHQEFLIAQQGLNTRASAANATTRAGQQLSHSDRIAQIAATATQKALDRANKLAVAAANDTSKQKGPAARKASRGQVQAINSLAQMIRSGSIVGPDGKRHKLTAKGKYATLMGVLGATKGQVDVAVRIAQGRKHVLYNPGALGILPEDVALLR